jgi:hypothetical protein
MTPVRTAEIEGRGRGANHLSQILLAIALAIGCGLAGLMAR